MTTAERYLAARAPAAAAEPYVASRLLAALDDYLHPIELVVSDGAGADALRDAARRAYAPTLMIAGAWAQPSLREGRGPTADGRAQAYVCRGQACDAPVTDPAALAVLLAPSA
jgi:uncharacterized protein YyaL (SSP411 family)